MDKKQQIVDYIKEIYNPIAIVLAGSRASTNFSSKSDWDFYVFTNEEYRWDADSFEGEVLDISIEKYPISDDYIFDTRFHPEQFLEIVFDTSGGLIEEAVQRTNKKHLQGPGEMSENDRRKFEKIMLRYIQKVENRPDMQGLTFYYFGLFYDLALRLWFQLKGRWPVSPHAALEHIKEEDSDFYVLLAEISSSKDVGVQLAAAKKVHDLLF